jgi:hypothetical protein
MGNAFIPLRRTLASRRAAKTISPDYGFERRNALRPYIATLKIREPLQELEAPSHHDDGYINGALALDNNGRLVG